jgi:hypothetical protein
MSRVRSPGKQAQHAAWHLARFDQVARHIDYQIHGNCETNSDTPTTTGNNRSINPDQTTPGINQGAAGIPKVNGRVGLNKVLI